MSNEFDPEQINDLEEARRAIRELLNLVKALKSGISVSQKIGIVKGGQVVGVLINNLYELNRFDEADKRRLQDIYRKSIHQAEIEASPETTKWYIALGLWHLDKRYYAEALANFNEVSKRGLLSPAVVYYRTLATIGNTLTASSSKRPKLIPARVIKPLENDLENATRQDSSQPHYWYLWALLKHEHYIPGIKTLGPTIEQLLQHASESLAQASEEDNEKFRAELDYMLMHAPDPDHFIQDTLNKHGKGFRSPPSA